MKVKWGNCLSSPFSVSNGVRQSGVLSPYLFALYIDDLPSQHARAGPLRVKCGQCGLVRASQNRKGLVQVRCSFHEGKVQFSSGLSSIADVYRNRAVPVQFGRQQVPKFLSEFWCSNYVQELCGSCAVLLCGCYAGFEWAIKTKNLYRFRAGPVRFVVFSE